MANIELNDGSTPSRSIIAGDERLTRGQNGELVWTEDRKVLTQADIDNSTEVESVVTGKLLAENLGGGGPEIITDWTTITTSTDILEGTGLSVLDLNDCEVECKDIQGSGNGILLSFRTANGTGAYRSSSRVKHLKSESESISSNTFAIVSGTDDILVGSCELKFKAYAITTHNLWFAGVESRSFALSGNGQVLSSYGLNQEYNDTLTAFTKILILDNTPSATVPFTLTYRIIRK